MECSTEKIKINVSLSTDEKNAIVTEMLGTISIPYTDREKTLINLVKDTLRYVEKHVELDITPVIRRHLIKEHAHIASMYQQ